ncbi:MAG TPA: GYD domain-containing protein [Acidisphaera sp.]|nr:GYD domain-containing protein [Acidisphaera sp.]
MALFMYQLAYTPESWAAQLKHPENRGDSVGKALAEAGGGKLVGSYYSFGEYDLVLIFDLPSAEAMSAIALAVGAGGAVKSAQTTVLISGHDAVAAMKKASAIHYKPAK